MLWRVSCVLLLMAAMIHGGEGLVRRCFVCRSRGPKGDCQDPFLYNATMLENPATHKGGVEAAPCASTWCSKVIESSQQVDDEDHGVATERSCLNSSPPDKEERCGNVLRGSKKVFMCFCQGDLCNGSKMLNSNSLFMTACMLIAIIWASK